MAMCITTGNNRHNREEGMQQQTQQKGGYAATCSNRHDRHNRGGMQQQTGLGLYYKRNHGFKPIQSNPDSNTVHGRNSGHLVV